MAVTPSIGRHVVAPLATGQVVSVGGRLGHQRVEPLLVDRPARGRVHVGHPERGRRGLRRRFAARQLVAEAGVVAEVGVPGGVDDDPRPDLPEAGARGDRQRLDAPVADRRADDRRVEQDPGAGLLDEPLPDDLEVLGEVGDPGPGAIGVRALDDRAELAQPGHDLVRDPADDLARAGAGREEAVEGVEDRGRGPAEERQRVDEQRARAGARACDRRGRARRSAPDDRDVDLDRAGIVGQLARPSESASEPAGSPASIQRPMDSRANSWSTTIEDAPMTPARPPSDERWMSRSRVASGSDRR